MSSENISVSLSRLALAKAIKTPDVGEEECEPWAKSIIFHQSHISPGMLENVMNPHQQRRPQQQQPRSRQQQHRGYPQQQQPQHHHHQQQQDPRSHRQSRQLLDQSGPNTRRDRTNQPQQSTSRPSSSYGMLTSSSANYLGQVPDEQQPRRTASPPINPRQPQQQQQQQLQKRQTRYVPSDDEEEEEEDGSDDASSQSSGPVVNVNHSLPPPVQQYHSLSPTEKKPTGSFTANERVAAHQSKKVIPLVSDDESEDEDDASSIADSQDDLEDNSRRGKTKAIFNEWTVPLVEDDSQEDEHMKARRMSTLRQLERGPSLHKRSRSDGAMEKIYTTDVAIDNGLVPGGATSTIQPLQEAEGGGIEQWRQTVLDAVDSIGATTLSSPAPVSSNGRTASSSSSSLIDNNLSSVSSNTMDPMASATTPPAADDTKSTGTRGRRTTLGEMDMMYYMQQQQLQMLQQQQIAQMQYQQAAWQVAQQQMVQQQQQQQQQHMMMAGPMDPQQGRRNKVKSVSAMDMMMQIEQEKEAKAAALRKPKRIDPSKAHIDGLLGKVKDQGKHNISFQQQTIKDRADRMAGRSTPRNDPHRQYQQQQQSYSRQSMMIPEPRLQQAPPMMMLGNPSDPYLLQQQSWQRPQQMSRSESSPGLQQPYMYRQSMALNSTPGLASSASLAAPPMMTASKSTGRPTSMMRPQSAWGNF